MYCHNTNMWNIRICKMFIRTGIPKHWRLSLVQVRNVYYLFWLLVFRHEERDTQFLLSWLFQHRSSVNSPAELSALSQNLNSLTQQTRAHPVDYDCTGLAKAKKSQLTAFFKNHQNSQPLASGHDVITNPVSFPIWGFLLWYLWLSHPPRASVNCTQCVHLHVH